MACGTPVIACRRGSMPEIIRDSETGVLVESTGGAITALTQIPGIDRAACRRDVAERFSVEAMADKYLTLYRQILG
jgi:glycosyltransferase involved in cell wall biosynthesis